MSTITIAVEDITALVSANAAAPLHTGAHIALPSLLDHDDDFRDLIETAGAELTMIGIEFTDPDDFTATVTLTREQFVAIDCVYEIDESDHMSRALEFIVDVDALVGV